MSGLVNLGNTCYLNSILQVLFHLPELKALCGKKLKLNKEYEHVDAGQAFLQLLTKYWKGKANAQALTKFKSVLGYHFELFSGAHQNDQHECLISLLDLLHHTLSYPVETLGSRKDSDKLWQQAKKQFYHDGLTTYYHPDQPYRSVVSDLFLGQGHKRTHCDNCGFLSHRFEVFKGLELQIPNRSEPIQLEHCLEYLVGPTQLDQKDAYRCDKCNQLNRSRQRYTIWRLPQVLVVVLVRNLTKYHNGEMISVKDQREVTYPEYLDMSPYLSNVNQPSHYHLMATACHYGSPSYGHCTCMVSNQRHWLNIDDVQVTEAPCPNGGAQSYLLFYRLQA